MQKLYFLSMLLLSMLLFNACKKEKGDIPVVCTTGFSATVSLIVQTNCAFSSGCHGSGSTNTGGPFTSYSLIAAKKDQIKAQVEAGIMPQGGSLSATDKTALISWINCGAPNN